MKQHYDQISIPKPFVKWAGGKRQLIPLLSQNIPNSFGAYYEPFLGGGAMVFHILSTRIGKKCHISDLNSELVLAYMTIRDKIDELIESLKKHEKNYLQNSKDYYYQIRKYIPKNDIETTSRLIFLNRTCFNGLYRVNKSGLFNVPLGKYSNPNIVNEENLRSVCHVLRSSCVSIKCRDFETIHKEVKKGDFIYFDPPYHPLNETSNFTSYTKKDFSFDDLKRLGELCDNLDSLGCNVLLSNSDSKVVKVIFNKKIWKISKIPSNRSINSNSAKRTGHSELIIKNY